MKKIFVFSILLLALKANSQVKNTIYFKADFINETMFQRYDLIKEKTLYDRVLGIDVIIAIDTIFKKYTIEYTDKDQQRIVMVYSYIRNYFPDGKNTASNKDYLMQMDNYSAFYHLGDSIYLFNYLDIEDEEKFGEFNKSFRIKNVKRK